MRDRRESRPKERSGSQEGQGNLGVPAPFAPAAGRRHSHAMSWRITPCPGGPLSPAAASRRNGGTAHPLLRVKAMGRKVASTGCAAVSAQGLPSADGKKRYGRPNGGKSPPLPRGKSFLFSLLTGLCYCIIIIVQHNKKGLRLCSGSFVGIARSTSRSWKS